MNNTCILCPQLFDWYRQYREKVNNSIFIFRAISLTSVGKPPCLFYTFYLVYILHCRIKLFLRHLPNCPCSNFSRYVDLFQEISPRIAKQLSFQVKLHHLRRSDHLTKGAISFSFHVTDFIKHVSVYFNISEIRGNMHCLQLSISHHEIHSPFYSIKSVTWNEKEIAP
jgi:hypothetical protein